MRHLSTFASPLHASPNSSNSSAEPGTGSWAHQHATHMQPTAIGRHPGRREPVPEGQRRISLLACWLFSSLCMDRMFNLQECSIQWHRVPFSELHSRQFEVSQPAHTSCMGDTGASTMTRGTLLELCSLPRPSYTTTIRQHRPDSLDHTQEPTACKSPCCAIGFWCGVAASVPQHCPAQLGYVRTCNWTGGGQMFVTAGRMQLWQTNLQIFLEDSSRLLCVRQRSGTGQRDIPVLAAIHHHGHSKLCFVVQLPPPSTGPAHHIE
ncbi:hypothetical protein V8C44DRAFT_47266 [Trichoderma aethiopicum]